ncbi:hypothetical protein LCGC14_0369690 [marine sediment metagenome]|uniref:Uncharacterized protein n=1 Tax=marine sediment metagenome TaxID=412755 RepID=A0A0F9T5G0_9ZZZZ
MHSSTRIFHEKMSPDMTRPREVREYFACCPCGVGLDVYVDSQGVLESTLKHYQEDGEIYHKCDTDMPCRLFWGKKIQEWPKL